MAEAETGTTVTNIEAKPTDASLYLRVKYDESACPTDHKPWIVDFGSQTGPLNRDGFVWCNNNFEALANGCKFGSNISSILQLITRTRDRQDTSQR